MSMKPKIDQSLKRTVTARIHQAIFEEFQRLRQSQSLSAEEVISRGIQLVQKELVDVGKAETLSRYRRGLTGSILRKMEQDIEIKQISEWEIENERNY